MKSISLSKNESTVLLALACVGLIIPNGIFLYYFFADTVTFNAAIANPVAVVFISEAFFLMFLVAWLLHRTGTNRLKPVLFIILSLLGSMAFSIPLAIKLIFRDGSNTANE